jgi:TonB family protein
MIYLIASLLIHGIILAYTGMTYIPHAEFSVQPSNQMVEVSFEQVSNSGETIQNKGGLLKSLEKIGKSNKTDNKIKSTSGVKVKANPEYFQNPPPEYPELAKQMHQEGLVMLAVDVDRDGIPIKVDILKSSGFHLLDQAALNAVRHWKFQPGRIGSIPIESTVMIPIRFRLEK